VAAWVTNKFSGFYLIRNHKNANNFKATEARENNGTDLASLKL
jgi:hypothetical protein